MRLRHLAATAVAATTLTVGAGFTTPAGAQDTGQPVVERICNREDQIQARLTKIAERLTRWTERLGELRARAEGAGRADLVDRIDDALQRIADAQQRIAEGSARLAETCAA